MQRQEYRKVIIAPTGEQRIMVGIVDGGQIVLKWEDDNNNKWSPTYSAAPETVRKMGQLWLDTVKAWHEGAIASRAILNAMGFTLVTPTVQETPSEDTEEAGDDN